MLNLHFLGTFHVIFSDGYEPAITTAKAKSLLAYLVTENDRPHRREQLAAMFWPEADHRSAAQSLRQALYGLRRQLQPMSTGSSGKDSAYLTVTRQDVAFNFDSAHWSDVGTFKALLSATQQHAHHNLKMCATCIALLQEAVGLYKGEFLAGLTLPDAEGFEEWRNSRREDFRAQVIRSLLTIADFYEQRREYNQARQYLMRLAEIEPWNEESHRRIMRLLALDGQRSAALQQFERARRLLLQELGVEPSSETLQLAQQIQDGRVLESTAEIDAPYKGLYPFSLADSTDFHGREETVDYVLRQIERQPAVVVIGSSGSGKSSLIQAGVLPVLLSIRQLPSATRPITNAPYELWTIVEFRPGADPFRSCAEALKKTSNVKIDFAELMQQLGGENAIESVRTLLPKHKRTLFFVDQFEELFTLCESPTVRRAFIDLLLQLANAGDDAPRVSLLASMRADFIGQALSYRPLAEALQHGGVVLGPMGRDELRRAIEEPARNRGVVFEAGLVNRLLDDVGEEPGNLPLLQFALAELWRRREGWHISHDAYDAIGRVAGALTSYADQVFAQLNAAEQALARRLFVQLVQPGDETGDIRRPALRSELGEPAWSLARKLADLRLVVTGHSENEESVEIVHEALIRNWSKLREWMDEDRDFRRWQQRLRTFLLHWQASGREEEALLRGLSLSEAARWIDVRRTELSEIEQTFIDASLEAHARRQAEIERARQQELEKAQQLAEIEHRRVEIELMTNRRLRWMMAALALLLVVAVSAAILAVSSRQEAQRFAQQAFARQLAAQSLVYVDSSTDLALLLNAEALVRITGQEDRTRLLNTFSINPFLERYLGSGEGDIVNIVVTSDGNHLLTVEMNGAVSSVRLWDVASGQTVSTLLPPLAYSAVTVASSGDHIATADGAQIRLWDSSGSEKLGEVTARIAVTDTILSLQFTQNTDLLMAKTIHGEIMFLEPTSLQERLRFSIPDGTEATTLSPDGSLLAVTQDIGEERGVNLWRTDTGEPTGVRLGGHTSNITSVTFTRDGQRAVTTSFDGTVRLWDTRSGELLFGPLNDHAGRVLSSALSPNERILATGGADHHIFLYDLVSRRMIGNALIGHDNWVRSLRFDHQGEMLYSGASDGELVRWNLARRQLLEGHTDRVRAVALSADGSTLATASFDRRVLLWDAERGELMAELRSPFENSLLQVVFSPDGRYVAAGGGGGHAMLWERESGELRHTWTHEDKSVVIALAFSPDSRTLAVGHFSGDVSLWDASTGALVSAHTRTHDGWALSLAFSPDGSVLATGGQEGKIKLWDVDPSRLSADRTLTAIGEVMEGHTTLVTSLLWSSNGEMLISGGADNTVRFWDVQKQRPAAAPIELETRIWGVQFYPPHGEQSLIILGNNGSVFLWDMTTHEPLTPALETHLETESFAVSPRGDAVFLASIDERVEKWQFDSRPWLQRSCDIAARSLSQLEWERYMSELPYNPVCTGVSSP